ncbi:GtrA family protein [Aromatoleum tolulyticum]|uniref:GtrA family protein n=1 Tax=Aromatoleum tolulyticum TaxID=34027 RepID=UPI00097031B2
MLQCKRWGRFIAGGALNTAVSYGVYFLLHLVVVYQLAYFAAYVVGVVVSYLFNAKFVFNVPVTIGGMIRYPLVYVAQYASSALVLGVLVEAGIGATFAPLLVSIVVLPVTYLLSSAVLRGGR